MHKNRAGALRPRHDLIICVFVSTPTIDREPLKTGRMIEVKHPVLFRLVFFLFLPVLQCMTLLVGFLIGFDSKHWELIVTLLGWVALAALFAYFIRGGDLFRWEIAPTSDDGAYFEDNADVSQCKNQSVGRRDA